MAKYSNIPVKPEIYAQVKQIADANNRGLGDQVSAWVERELPVCDHPKSKVSIQIYPNANLSTGAFETRSGWFCPTCNRVYQYSALEIPAVVKIKKQAKKDAQAVTSSAGYDKL